MKRPLLLTGFMATGKSTVGRLLAEVTSSQYLDLDELVVREAGMGVAEIFEVEGEAAFRARERRVLLQLLERWRGRPVVVGLGGGALLDSDLRVEALAAAVVVCLTASPAEIARRARAQEGEGARRPLLCGPDPEGTIGRLLEQRATAYRECHGQVPTEAVDLQAVCARVRAIWEADRVVVPAGEETYRVGVGEGLIESELPSLLGNPTGVVLVSDSNVAPLHAAPVRRVLSAAGMKEHFVELVPGEEHKDLKGLSGIFQGAFDAHLDRQGLLIGLGGGVTTDMTGFAAASWVRGVRWIGLPTTLLAMVDASVGGKTGVDFHSAKNAVGAFWQPCGVLCDVATLATEVDRMYRGAISEVIKTALIGDPDLLTLLESHPDALLSRDPGLLAEVVERCVRVKARIVGLDERETGVRATLNLGHTIGHALESAGGFTALTHGEAVGLGLIAALRFGERRGVTPRELTQRVRELLVRLGMVVGLEKAALERSVGLIGKDKKRAGSQVRFVFARAAGDVTTELVELKELERTAVQLADPG